MIRFIIGVSVVSLAIGTGYNNIPLGWGVFGVGLIINGVVFPSE